MKRLLSARVHVTKDPDYKRRWNWTTRWSGAKSKVVKGPGYRVEVHAEFGLWRYLSTGRSGALNRAFVMLWTSPKSTWTRERLPEEIKRRMVEAEHPEFESDWLSKPLPKFVAPPKKKPVLPFVGADKVILEVQALYDFALPAVTVQFRWWPDKWFRKGEGNQRIDKPRIHYFSLTKNIGLQSSSPNHWWGTIQRWVKEEADHQGFRFAKRCVWGMHNAPNTLEHATTPGDDYDPSTAAPFHGIMVGLRNRRPEKTRRMLDRPQNPVKDFTPLRFRPEILCVPHAGPVEGDTPWPLKEIGCGRTMGDHPAADPCLRFKEWTECKAKWLIWYVKTMGKGPTDVDLA